MVKLKPLYKKAAISKQSTGKSNHLDVKSQSSKQHEQKSYPKVATKSNDEKEVEGDQDDEEDDEWARIEKEQNKNRGKGDVDEDDDSDDDSDDDDDEEEDDIKFEGNQGETTMDYDFEFVDIDTDHIESITTLMKTLIPNPTTAYQLSTHIYEQGTTLHLFVLFISDKFSYF